MRIFLSIIILIFSYQSWTKADDITEFQIDEIGVGDNLLNYYSLKEINKMLTKTVSSYKSKRIKRVFFESKDGSKYLQYNFHYINDKSYKIVNVKGIMLMENKSKECNLKKKQISNDIEDSIKFTNKKSFVDKHNVDKSGKSLIDRVQYMVDGGIIEVSCWKWSKEIKKNKPWRDTLQVSIRSEIFNDWLTNEAYK